MTKQSDLTSPFKHEAYVAIENQNPTISLPLMLTDFHAKYYAYDLHRTGGGGIDRLGRALFAAAVDLNECFLSPTDLNPPEKQWDLIYVNGDHTLDNLAERLAAEDEAPCFKVRTIEPEFHRLMARVRRTEP